MPVSFMQRQVERGYQWLKSGRIAGIIFLSTGTVGAGLEAVAWTRDWIRVHGDGPLATLAPKPTRP